MRDTTFHYFLLLSTTPEYGVYIRKIFNLNSNPRYLTIIKSRNSNKINFHLIEIRSNETNYPGKIKIASFIREILKFSEKETPS